MSQYEQALPDMTSEQIVINLTKEQYCENV